MRMTEEEYAEFLSRQNEREEVQHRSNRKKKKKKKGQKSHLEEECKGILNKLSAPPYEREYKILSGRRYRADFAWPAAKIALEVNGGLYTPVSGHRSISGIERDMEKSNAAQLDGWIYLQVGSKHLKNMTYMASIVAFVKAKVEIAAYHRAKTGEEQ
jgi:very-short-patch-repair endonuclease